MATKQDIQEMRALGMEWERALDLEALYRSRGFGVASFPRGKNAHYPTDAGSCLRKRALEWFRAPATEDDTFESSTIFAMGNALGELQAMMAMRSGIYLGDEASFELVVQGLTYPFSGRIDVVIQDPNYDAASKTLTLNPIITAMENKTIKDNGYYDKTYASGFQTFGVTTAPKPENVKQLHHYLAYLHDLAEKSPDGLIHFHEDFPGLQPPRHGFLCYLNKNDQRMIIWKVKWSPKVWASIVDEAVVVEHYLRNDTLPPRHPKGKIGFATEDNPDAGIAKGDVDYGKGKFPCSWNGGACKFLRLCWSDVIIEKAQKGEASPAEFERQQLLDRRVLMKDRGDEE